MVIVEGSLLAVLLVPFVWGLGAYLFIVCLRLMLGQFAVADRVCTGLSHLTDPLPDAIGRWLSARRGRPVPAWVAWTIVIASALLMRHLLIRLIVSSA